MPEGKVHDAISILLTPPAFVLGYAMSGDAGLSAAAAAAFLFGGLMFGPDLDTLSRQYSRWRLFKIVWYPYRTVFRHRSRWSHGLIFGTLFRVVYLFGALTLAALAVYTVAELAAGRPPEPLAAVEHWTGTGELAGQIIGRPYLLALFFGTWLGAASHTLTDMAGSFVKTGRVIDLL